MKIVVVWHEAPDVGGQRPLLLDEFDRAFCIVDDGLDFAPVAHNSGVEQQAADGALIKASNFSEIELAKCVTKIFPFYENRAPAQPRLKTFQACGSCHAKARQPLARLDGAANAGPPDG